MSSESTSVDSSPQERLVRFVADHVKRGFLLGKVPLFVVGAGISQGVVPLLSEMGRRLGRKLEESNADKWLIEHSRALGDGLATRRQAAELFSAVQGHGTAIAPLGVWPDFSDELLVKGFSIEGVASPFYGLADRDNVEPKSAHRILGRLLRSQSAFVISLNFDGLTHRATAETGGPALSLHSATDVRGYFSAASRDFVPAVFKVRGDVFYVRCTNDLCPWSRDDHPLDRLNLVDPFDCLVCGSLGSLRLQFSFPGYREKEEAAHPMLWAIRRFVASRISTVIVIGLSGSWDRYLLDFLFDLISERQLLLVDVKRGQSDTDRCAALPANPIERFRRTYYPSIQEPDDLTRIARHASYLFAWQFADAFLEELESALDKSA